MSRTPRRIGRVESDRFIVSHQINESADYERKRRNQAQKRFIPKNDLNGVTVGIAVNGQEVFKTQADNKRNCPDHVCICRVCTPERVKHDRKRQAHVHVLVQEIVVIVFQHFSGRVSLPAQFTAALTQRQIKGDRNDSEIEPI